MKKMMAQYMAKNEEIYDEMQKVKRFLFIAQVLSLLKILLIVIPLILAIVYLPPFLEGAFGQLQEIYGLDGIPSL